MDDTPSAQKCHQCGAHNPISSAFCSSCGSPLALQTYISDVLKKQLAETLKEREHLETESAIKVFERAWSWLKLIGTVCGILIVVVTSGIGLVGYSKFKDLSTATDQAKTSVTKAAESTTTELDKSFKQATVQIGEASRLAQQSASSAIQTATRQSKDLTTEIRSSRDKLSSELGTFTGELQKSRSQLQEATTLRPEMDSLQKQMLACQTGA